AAVALDAFAAEVPVGDMAVRVEHVDRVIDDALHQHAELPLAGDERIGAAAIRGKIDDAGGKGSVPAGAGADTLDREANGGAAAVLAGEPAAALAAALPAGDTQVGGDPRLRRIRREQLLEENPAQFLRRVARLAFRRVVPAGYLAVAVEQVKARSARPLGCVEVGRVGSGSHRFAATYNIQLMRNVLPNA